MASTQPLIAVRIKDGIFVGNVTAAHDEDFLYVNKVTHIVNCAGAEVSDLFADAGIEYLSFPWKDTPGAVNTTVMFDSGDRNMEQAVRFMDKAIDNGDCVLVHSVYGLSRSPALVAAYFMVKYGWKVDNALSFLTMAHQEMNIKPHFLRQLRMFGKRHDVETDIFTVEVEDGNFALDNDQWMLRNTLLNGLTSDVQARNELYHACSDRVELPELLYKNPTKRRRRLAFVDTRQGTAVGSTASTPVTNVKVYSHQHHADPNGEPSFPGSAGSRAVRNSKPKAPIAARHSTPNTRQLESRPEVNPKGRQLLALRQPPPPVQQQQVQQQQQQQSIARTTSALQQQQLGGQDPVMHRAFSATIARPAAQYDQSPTQPMIVQRGAATLVDTTQRKTSNVSAAAEDRGSAAQRIVAAANVIRSPFALTSSSVPRNGSPLPQQRQSRSTTTAMAPQLAPTTLDSMLRTAQPPSVQEIRSGVTQQRAGSPMAQQQQQLSVASARRTSSPVNRTIQPAPQPSLSSQMMSTRASSPRANPTGAAYNSASSIARRPSSPLSRGPQGMPSVASSSASPRIPSYSASTLQQQRALSPTNRTVQPLPRTSSPVQRPSTIVRTSSPRGQQVLPAQPAFQGRVSSPMRSSLADQYLGSSAMNNSSSQPLPRTSSGASLGGGGSSSNILRRGQPVPVAAARRV